MFQWVVFQRKLPELYLQQFWLIKCNPNIKRSRLTSQLAHNSSILVNIRTKVAYILRLRCYSDKNRTSDKQEKWLIPWVTVVVVWLPMMNNRMFSANYISQWLKVKCHTMTSQLQLIYLLKTHRSSCLGCFLFVSKCYEEIIIHPSWWLSTNRITILSVCMGK